MKTTCKCGKPGYYWVCNEIGYCCRQCAGDQAQVDWESSQRRTWPVALRLGRGYGKTARQLDWLAGWFIQVKLREQLLRALSTGYPVTVKACLTLYDAPEGIHVWEDELEKFDFEAILPQLRKAMGMCTTRLHVCAPSWPTGLLGGANG